MAVRMTKPWLPLTTSGIERLAAHMGVYQLGDAQGKVLYIGVADGRSRFGLRGELEGVVARPLVNAVQYRSEVTTAYATRWQELLMVHVADFGALPIHNPARDGNNLGRLSPA